IMVSGDTPVIVGPDGPSLGGFVVPAAVIQADLWKLGQLRPGDHVHLHPTTPRAAQDARTTRHRLLTDPRPALAPTPFRPPRPTPPPPPHPPPPPPPTPPPPRTPPPPPPPPPARPPPDPPAAPPPPAPNPPPAPRPPARRTPSPSPRDHGAPADPDSRIIRRD